MLFHQLCCSFYAACCEFICTRFLTTSLHRCRIFKWSHVSHVTITQHNRECDARARARTLENRRPTKSRRHRTRINCDYLCIDTHSRNHLAAGEPQRSSRQKHTTQVKCANSCTQTMRGDAMRSGVVVGVRAVLVVASGAVNWQLPSSACVCAVKMSKAGRCVGGQTTRTPTAHARDECAGNTRHADRSQMRARKRLLLIGCARCAAAHESEQWRGRSSSSRRGWHCHIGAEGQAARDAAAAGFRVETPHSCVRASCESR